MLSRPTTSPTPSTFNSPRLTTNAEVADGLLHLGRRVLLLLLVWAGTHLDQCQHRDRDHGCDEPRDAWGRVRRIDLPPCAAVGENPRTRLENRAASFATNSVRPLPCETNGHGVEVTRWRPDLIVPPKRVKSD